MRCHGDLVAGLNRRLNKVQAMRDQRPVFSYDKEDSGQGLEPRLITPSLEHQNVP